MLPFARKRVNKPVVKIVQRDKNKIYLWRERA